MKEMILGNGYKLQWEVINGVVNGFLNGNEITHSKPSLLWSEEEFISYWQLACASPFEAVETYSDGYGYNAMSSFIFGG